MGPGVAETLWLEVGSRQTLLPLETREEASSRLRKLLLKLWGQPPGLMAAGRPNHRLGMGCGEGAGDLPRYVAKGKEGGVASC